MAPLIVIVVAALAAAGAADPEHARHREGDGETADSLHLVRNPFEWLVVG